MTGIRLAPTLTVALMATAALACRPHAAREREAKPATATVERLVPPEPVRHTPELTVSGTLKPRWQAKLAFPVGGTLERIAVRRSQSVAAGAPLLVLETATASAQLSQAEAAVGAARAQLDLAQDSLRRLEAIAGQEGGVTAAQLVQARGQRDLASAQLRSSTAQREQALVNLRHHTLRAPFAGVVTRIPDGMGVAVAAGSVLVELESTQALVLETTLTQAEAAEVRVGAAVEVSVPATGARSAGATISAVVPSVDGGTSRVPVEIDVPNGDGRFLPHAFARVRLPSGRARDALRVPAAAVFQREGAFALWIAGPDGKAAALPVRVLAQEADAAVVEVPPPGLPRGARVVALPPLGLSEGQLLAEAAPPTAR